MGPALLLLLAACSGAGANKEDDSNRLPFADEDGGTSRLPDASDDPRGMLLGHRDGGVSEPSDGGVQPESGAIADSGSAGTRSEAGRGGRAGTGAAGSAGSQAGMSGGAGMGAAGSGPEPCEDGDNDGVCDEDDLCEGFDDADDVDDDGKPDGCDRCQENGPDQDGNGYPDSCDALLWRLETDPQPVTPLNLPISNCTAILTVRLGDQRSDQREVSAHQGLNAFPNTVSYDESSELVVWSKSPGVVSHRSTFSELAGSLTDPTAHGKLSLRYNGGTETTYLLFEASPIEPGSTITRVVASGLAASGGSVAFAWEVRGY